MGKQDETLDLKLNISVRKDSGYESEILFQSRHLRSSRLNPKRPGGSVAMKSLVGAVAVLFLVTTFALAAEGYQPAPFPQDANTALAGSETSSVTGEIPGSMASSQSSEIQVVTSPAEAGSPFPSVANPSAGADTSGQTAPELSRQHDLGSPFPSAASPANR